MQNGRAGGLFRSEQNSFNALVDCRDIVLLHCSSDVTSHRTRDIQLLKSRSLESLPWGWKPQAPPERVSQTPFCESRFSLQQQRK